jgi:hypothetical protein
MNRSPASKTKVVSKAVRVASKAAADSRSQASRASSPDRAVSKSLGKAAKAVSGASAKVTASPTRSSFPRLCPGTFLLARDNRFYGLCWTKHTYLRPAEAELHHHYCRI